MTKNEFDVSIVEKGKGCSKVLEKFTCMMIICKCRQPINGQQTIQCSKCYNLHHLICYPDQFSDDDLLKISKDNNWICEICNPLLIEI